MSAATEGYKGGWIKLIIYFLWMFLFIFLSYIFSGFQIPNTSNEFLWLFSGILLLITTTFYTDPHFASPKSTVLNSIACLLVLFSAYDEASYHEISKILLFAYTVILCLSIIVLQLESQIEQNNLLRISRNIFAKIGKSNFLISILFIYLLLDYGRLSKPENYMVTLFWGSFILLRPQEWHTRLADQFDFAKPIASIKGYINDDLCILTVSSDKSYVLLKEKVYLNTSLDGRKANRIGVVVKSHHLTNERWVLCYLVPESIIISSQMPSLRPGMVSAADENLSQCIATNTFPSERIIGLVAEKTSVESLVVIVTDTSIPMEIGTVLFAFYQGKKVFAQIASASIEVDSLQGFDEARPKLIRCLVLGTWNPMLNSFEGFNWLPDANSPVFLVDEETQMLESLVVNGTNIRPFGTVQNINVKNYVDFDKLFNQHLAITGVTGSGKTHCVKRIIDIALQLNYKVICIDITKQYSTMWDESTISSINFGSVERFLRSDDRLGIYNIIDMSNTSGSLEDVQKLLERIFTLAQTNTFPNKCIIVLEEAHTIIPEMNFLAVGADFGAGKALVAKMSQIALQGRKYGIGLVIVTQRTANVSKSVLTQCNSMINFRAHDNTSIEFIQLYAGSAAAYSIPTLKKFHALVCGVGFLNERPTIVDFTDRDLSQ